MKFLKRTTFLLTITAATLIMVVGSSCNRKIVQSLVTAHYQNKEDSVSLVDTYHADTVFIPADTVQVGYPIFVKCPDGAAPVFTPVKMNNSTKRSDVTVAVDAAGTIQVDAHCKELQEQVQVKDQMLTRVSHERDSLSHNMATTVTITQRFIPGFYKFTMGFFWLIVLLLIGYGLYKLNAKTPIIPTILKLIKFI